VGPFTFRTTFVNNRAKDSLFPKYSMFHRATAMEYDSMVKLIEDGAKRSRVWQPFPEKPSGQRLHKLAKDNKFPYLSDGVALYNKILGFVESWVSHAYTDVCNDDAALAFYGALVAGTAGFSYTLPATMSHSSLCAALAQFMFTVTGFHELVGSVSEYVNPIWGAGLRSRPESTQNDVQSWAIGTALIATTSLRTPELMSTFPNYFGEAPAPDWEIGFWQEFQRDLGTLADQIDERNKTRRFAFQFFNPRILECAVSV